MAERQPDIARSIAVELGSRIEIPFDGTGWTYLGERDGKDGILYESRRYQDSGLVFVLNTLRQGDFVLRFQRQDLLRGTTNEELVAVKVGPKAAVLPSGTSSAPAGGGIVAAGGTSAASGTSSAALPGGTSSRGGQSSSSPGASVQPSASSSAGGSVTATSPTTGPGTASAATTAAASPSGMVSPMPSTGAASGTVPAIPASPAPASSAQGLSPASFAASLPLTPEGIVRAARAELSAGRVANCLAALDRFLELHPEGMDEVYYLYGVALEQNGATKDIKRAYSCYKKLHDDFPQSQLWDMAADRMSYIERHYFSVR